MIKTNRQPNKMRYLDAIANRKPAGIPFYEFEVDYSLVHQILGKNTGNIRSYLLEPNDYANFINITGMDMVYVAMPWKPGRSDKLMADGRLAYAGGTFTHLSDLSTIILPNYDQEKNRIEEILKAFNNSKAGIVLAISNAPTIAMTAMGYERYYMGLIEYPSFIIDFQNRLNETIIKQVELLLSYPIDVLFTSSQSCMKTGPMMSNELLEKFHYPYLKTMINLAHENKLPLELHADGDVSSLIPRFIELGVDVLHPLENTNSLTKIYDIKKQFGESISLHGNIDVEEILIKGTKEQIKQSVIEHVKKLNNNGGYIISSSHDINQNVPIENFITMIETIHNL